MRAGRLVVTVGEAQAFDGVITGAIAVARSEAGADFSSHMQFSGVNLHNCLDQLFSIDQLSGSGSLAFSVASSGRSVKELASNVNGTVNVAATDGGLSGLNVEQVMRRLQRSPLAGGGDLRTGRTPFERLNIGLRIVHGLATIDDVALEGPNVRLAVTGTTSIPEREFNLAGTANLISDAPDAAPLFALPFTVKGQWTSPSIAPDTRAMMEKSPLVKSLLDAQERRQDRGPGRNQDKATRDDVQDAINRIITPAAPLRAQ
jgi:AsmA protein